MNFRGFLKISAIGLWSLAFVLAIAVFSLTRLTLMVHAIVFAGQPASGLIVALLLGFLRDLPVAAAITSPFALFEIVFPRRFRNVTRAALFGVYIFSLLFVAVSEFIFWDEFAVRFNFIALDYLVFTTEVIGNIRQSYPVGKIVAVLLVLTLIIFWTVRNRLRAIRATTTAEVRQWPMALPVLAFVLLAYALTPPDFSANAYTNELADNGWRSFVWAARQNKLNYRQFYTIRPDDEVRAQLQKLAGGRVVTAAGLAPDSLAKPPHQPNVVVVMMESLSAEYMNTFGNQLNLTPNLDRLSKEGLFFSRLYATGTRTVRGLEALSASLPPLPGKSIVRWPNISNLNTLGSTLAARGWKSEFLYGGYGMFDNMNGYFGAQGYAVTDRTTFKEGLVEFENIWGVADEHLFDQVIINLDKAYAQGQPVFAHVMTASNHIPFTYPAGRIDIPSPGHREGGVKYADYAIGKFVRDAGKRPWFDNTIFLFVADHCAGSSGKAKIPVFRYHIPAIIYAPKLIKPQLVDTLASQIDLAPTLLGILGLDGDNHFVGNNLLNMPASEGRALLSTYQNIGYLKGDVLTVLEPKRKVEAFRVSPDGKEATPIELNKKLVDEAIAYFQGAAILMDRHGHNGGAN